MPTHVAQNRDVQTEKGLPFVACVVECGGCDTAFGTHLIPGEHLTVCVWYRSNASGISSRMTFFQSNILRLVFPIIRAKMPRDVERLLPNRHLPLRSGLRGQT